MGQLSALLILISKKETPSHNVRLSETFCLVKYLITFKDWMLEISPVTGPNIPASEHLKTLIFSGFSGKIQT